jgi:hypothetical protein
VILPIVLYGFETWSLRLRREHRLSVERKISEPKTEEVTKEWRRLNKTELVELHSLPNLIRGISSRRMICAKACGMYEERGGAYRLLREKIDGKKPLGRPRSRYYDNIKMDI